MSTVTDLLNEALQAAKELEDQVVGSNPIKDQLAKDKADLEAFALDLSQRVTQLEAGIADMADREAKVIAREEKVEAAKTALKAQASAKTAEA